MEKILTQPWLAKKLAGYAEAPGDLAIRTEILLLLSRLSFKEQKVSLAGCFERDQLFEVLFAREEYGALLNLLHSDLARWLPEVSEHDTLPWLIRRLQQIKQPSTGKKAKLIMETPAGSKVWQSTAMFEALVSDAVDAAAGAWVRCLGGIGGVKRALAVPLADKELAETVAEHLAQDPRALVLLIEDAQGTSPESALSELTPEEYRGLLQKGLTAAKYCVEAVSKGI